MTCNNPVKALASTFARWANRAMDPKYEGDRGAYVHQADDWAFGAYMVASELSTGAGDVYQRWHEFVEGFAAVVREEDGKEF